jgi:hypothetical protein
VRQEAMEGGAQSWKGTEGRRGRRGSQRETRMGRGAPWGCLTTQKE